MCLYSDQALLQSCASQSWSCAQLPWNAGMAAQTAASLESVAAVALTSAERRQQSKPVAPRPARDNSPTFLFRGLVSADKGV